MKSCIEALVGSGSHVAGYSPQQEVQWSSEIEVEDILAMIKLRCDVQILMDLVTRLEKQEVPPGQDDYVRMCRWV